MASAALSSSVLAVLRAATVLCDRVVLPAQLDRSVYKEVNEVLSRTGGTWKGGKIGAHLYEVDPRPLIQAVIESGVMPDKNPLAFVPTPRSVVDLVVARAQLRRLLDRTLGRPLRGLEPNGGRGALANAMRAAVPDATIDVVELDPLNAGYLRAGGWEVHQGDFLSFRPEHRYDFIWMNPPFAVAGDKQAYIAHVEHAWSLLAPGGVLVAITAAGFTFRSDRRAKAFKAFVEEHGEWERLPEKSFAESGTNVETALLVVSRPVSVEIPEVVAPAASAADLPAATAESEAPAPPAAAAPPVPARRSRARDRERVQLALF